MSAFPWWKACTLVSDSVVVLVVVVQIATDIACTATRKKIAWRCGVCKGKLLHVNVGVNGLCTKNACKSVKTIVRVCVHKHVSWSACIKCRVMCVCVCVWKKRERCGAFGKVDGMAKALQAPQRRESSMWKTFWQPACCVETAPWIAKRRQQKQKWRYHSPKYTNEKKKLTWLLVQR